MNLCRFAYKIMVIFFTAYLLIETAAAVDTKATRTIIDNFMFGYSPRSAAMGFCSINLVDGGALFHNPAAMGLYHLDKAVSATWVEYPKFGYNYDNLRNFGMSVRMPYIGDHINSGEDFRTSLSLGFSMSRLDYIPWGLSTYTWFDKSNYYSVGIGLDYFARLGFGYMYSDRRTTLLSDFPEYFGVRVRGDAQDYGLIIEFPVIRTLSRLTGKDLSYQELNFELLPSFAYVWSNVRGNPDFADRFDNAGISILGEIKYNQTLLSSLLLVKEKERYSGDDYYDRYNRYNTDKVGYEFCFAGFYYLRWGNFVNYLNFRDYEGFTRGFGLSFRGISNWLYSLEIIKDKDRISDWILKNVDITYDVSNYDWDLGNSFEDNIFNIGMSF